MSLSAPRLRSLVVLLAGASFLACRSPSSTNERTVKPGGATSVTAPASSIATIVSNPKHDFGRVTQADTLRHVFATHNHMSVPLRVDPAPEVLGCSGVAVPDSLAPNQSGEFRVTCRATIHGPLRVSLPLRANGRGAGELSLTAEVEPLLTFDRALLELNVPFGRADEARAHLRGKLARRARLTLAGAAPPGMDVQVLSRADGTPEGAVLRLTRTPVGVHAGTLRFETGLAEASTVDLPYAVKVTGTLAVSPTNPVLDLAAPEGTRSVITVTSKQPGFRVERAEVVEGPFSTSIEKAPGGYAVEVSVVAAKFPEGARGANGRIRIVSNDRTEPTKEVSLFALGKPPEP